MKEIHGAPSVNGGFEVLINQKHNLRATLTAYDLISGDLIRPLKYGSTEKTRILTRNPPLRGILSISIVGVSS